MNKTIKIKARLFQYITKIAATPPTLDPETNEPAYVIINPAGDKIWYKTHHDLINARNHYRIDRATGKKEWYRDNRLHRDNDLPAVQYPNGNKEWRIAGRLHREFGPAKVFKDNEEYWYGGYKKPKETTYFLDLVVGRNEDGGLKREAVNCMVDWTGTITHSVDDMSPIWHFNPETLELIRQPKLNDADENIPIARLKDIESGNI